MATHSATHSLRVIHLLYPGFGLLELSGPLRVFREARGPDGASPYRNLLVSMTGGSVESDSGGPLITAGLRRLRLGPSDRLVIPGGAAAAAACEDETLVRWLSEHGRKAGAVASTCSGAFLLGSAGLLRGRRAVTHWEHCDELQRLHPGASVEREPMFIEDEGVWTSAGVTAGIDLALALVERDLGRPASLDVARRLVFPAGRTGAQSQFTARPGPADPDSAGPFDELHRWIGEHLAQDLRVEHLAEQCAMTPRTFHRAYVKSCGATPAQAVTRLRVEAARTLLEESNHTVVAIANLCGFSGEEHMRRSFQRQLGLAPSAYRAQWGGQRIRSAT